MPGEIKFSPEADFPTGGSGSEQSNTKKQNKDNIQPKSPREQLNELISQYSSLDVIPEERLKEIGFVKTIYEGGVRITSEETIKERQQKEMEKVMGTPFDIIPVEAKIVSIGRRMLVGDLVNIGRKYFDRVLYDNAWGADDNTPLVYGEESPVVALRETISVDKEIMKKICDRFDLPEDDRAYGYFVADVFTDGISGATLGARDSFTKEWEQILKSVNDKVESSQDDMLSSKDTEEVYNKLEQSRGKLADPDFYNSAFMGRFYATAEYHDYSRSEKGENLTPFEASKQTFVYLLEKYDEFKVVIQQLELSKSHFDFLNILSKITIDKNDEEKRLLSEMKIASVEEKREKSGKLKALKREREEKIKLIAGIKEFYDIPKIAAANFSDIIKAVQKVLIRGSSKDDDVEFKLDARPNRLLDSNPGKVSGDCTDGVPLPFTKPDVPIYNVKVFRNEDSHIGNIYLLMTNTIDNISVWHLDAIQIPSAVDWDGFIENLFDSLLKAAKNKGVAYITVSREPSRISNYDYIQDAVLKYCEKINAGQGVIDVPDYKSLGDQYSNPQCNGEVFLIPA